MNTTKKALARDRQPHFPSLETIQQELGKAQSIDDFFGKEGILARLFASTLETMVEAELTEHQPHQGLSVAHVSGGECAGGGRKADLTRRPILTTTGRKPISGRARPRGEQCALTARHDAGRLAEAG